MAEFRVTKFNPAFRASSGEYTRADWTSVSDVGRVDFDGRVVTLGDYLLTESSYVSAARVFLRAANIQRLCISNLESHPEPALAVLPRELREESLANLDYCTEGRHVADDEIDWAIRLNLRNLIWCRLLGERGFFIHFGWDFYMYVGGDDVGEEPAGVPRGIYVEPFASPYHPDEEDD
jgi:hypothetical protein